MKVAIVGTSVNLSEGEERDVRQYIGMVLNKHDRHNDIIISGGSKGVDTTVFEIAESLGFKIELYKPTIESWEYYKERNILIAKNCDELYCITVPTHRRKCYHHDKPQDHEKTAGCWTLKQAKLLGKECKLLVTPRR